MGKQILKDLFFFCGVTLAVIVFSEGPVKWLWSLVPVGAYVSPPSDNVFVADPHLKYVALPGGGNGEVDQNGYFYNTDVRDTYDMVAIGDSVTEGAVSMSWPRALELRTGKHVYNMGVRGYGGAQYLYQTDKALSFHPRTIIVMINLARGAFNTFDTVYNLDAWKPYRMAGIENTEGITAGNFLKKTHFNFQEQRDFLRQHSAIYSFLGNESRILREKLGLASPLVTGTKDWSTTDPDATLLHDKVPSQRTLFWASSVSRSVDLEDKNIAEGDRLLKVFISELAKKARAKNVNVVIVVAPSKELVYAKAVGDDGDKNIFYRKVIVNEKKMEQGFLDECATEHILCYDMLPFLEQKLTEGEVIYQKTVDLHPTAHGYEVYAKGIEEYLRANNLL